ncbi:hypothetical protein PILCRDRAFT_811508 [Piloderma croceum F 1598]|uniref:Small nuclear ribonucleoprotein G n=1 Tax=Piloderma croceum (strain F 1598) TaxID=765440 RepID=A0A0C3GK33_PILCF|nr:hypothetical protein PILCRDRAFT_811508 [Piloderma croceum F 1598]
MKMIIADIAACGEDGPGLIGQYASAIAKSPESTPTSIRNSRLFANMSKASQPELKKFMDKKLFVHLQGGRKVSGVLRGYDLFLNLVIDDALEETTPAQKHPIGTVVIRGNSVTSMETLEATRQ